VRGAADGKPIHGLDHGSVHSAQWTATVGDVMHRGVVSCHIDTPATNVARIMTAHRIHAVVVTGGAALPRLVTDAEIASALYSGSLEVACADDISIGAPLLRLSDTLDDALARMHEQASTHAVAVDRAFRTLGILSVLDLVEARHREGVE
jgi:CBS domain-containing protein